MIEHEPVVSNLKFRSISMASESYVGLNYAATSHSVQASSRLIFQRINFFCRQKGNGIVPVDVFPLEVLPGGTDNNFVGGRLSSICRQKGNALRQFTQNIAVKIGYIVCVRDNVDICPQSSFGRLFGLIYRIPHESRLPAINVDLGTPNEYERKSEPNDAVVCRRIITCAILLIMGLGLISLGESDSFRLSGYRWIGDCGVGLVTISALLAWSLCLPVTWKWPI